MGEIPTRFLGISTTTAEGISSGLPFIGSRCARLYYSFARNTGFQLIPTREL